MLIDLAKDIGLTFVEAKNLVRIAKQHLKEILFLPFCNSAQRKDDLRRGDPLPQHGH